MTGRSNSASLAVLLLAILSVGCSGVPSGVIPPDRMARILADLEVAETYVEIEPARFRGDSMKMVLMQSVYDHNGVTMADVDSSLMWYGRNIDRYSEVMKTCVSLLEADEEKARIAGGRRMKEQNTPSISADGDSVDVWTLPRMWRISRTSPASMLRFYLSRDRNWEPGDGYELHFKTHDGKAPVSVTLAADYQRDRRTYVSRSAVGDGWHSVKLQLDSASGASQVYGFISYMPVGNETLVVDSIRLIRSHWKSGRTKVPAGQHNIGKR